jgi:hypothetical protein
MFNSGSGPNQNSSSQGAIGGTTTAENFNTAACNIKSLQVKRVFSNSDKVMATDVQRSSHGNSEAIQDEIK